MIMVRVIATELCQMWFFGLTMYIVQPADRWQTRLRDASSHNKHSSCSSSNKFAYFYRSVYLYNNITIIYRISSQQEKWLG